MVKALVLAAGYGTRLESDIRADTSGKYASLIGTPKPLIPVDGKPLLSHWLTLILDAGLDANDLFIITNAHFHSKFVAWAQANGVATANVINDGTTNNDNRLGACRDVQFALEHAHIDDDIMVIGGDTLFFEDFSIRTVLSELDRHSGANVILWYPIEHDNDTLKTGVLELSADGIVTAFLEKPHPSTTVSRKGCPCFYLYRRQTLPKLKEFITQAKTLGEADAPGHFTAWLWSRSPCYAHGVSGRFDIGGLQTYIECEDKIARRKAANKQQT